MSAARHRKLYETTPAGRLGTCGLMHIRLHKTSKAQDLRFVFVPAYCLLATMMYSETFLLDKENRRSGKGSLARVMSDNTS
jgi:hypothetical protein